MKKQKYAQKKHGHKKHGHKAATQNTQRVVDTNPGLCDTDEVWLTKAETSAYLGWPESIFDRAFEDSFLPRLINGERRVALSVIKDVVENGLRIEVDEEELSELRRGNCTFVEIPDSDQGGDGRPATRT